MKALEHNQQQQEKEAMTLRQGLKELSDTNAEMKSEITILIASHDDIKLQAMRQAGQLSQQAAALEQFEFNAQQKEAELQKRENFIARLQRQLDEKRSLLHGVNLKIQQLNRSMLSDYQQQLLTKDKELEALKAMAKDHHSESQTKAADIVRLQRQLGKLKAEHKATADKLKAHTSKGTAEDYTNIHIPAVDVNKSMQSPDVGVKESRKLEVSPELLGPHRSYKEKYERRLEDYYEAISRESYHNNSLHIRNVLSHNYNVFVQEIRVRKPVPSVDVSSTTPQRLHRKAQLREREVNGIIERSLHHKAISSDKPLKRKAFNLRIANHARMATPLLAHPTKKQYT